MICNIQQASFKCVVIQFRTRINATIITTIYTRYMQQQAVQQNPSTVQYSAV